MLYIYITNQIIEFVGGTTLPKTAILLMAISLVFCDKQFEKSFENMCFFSGNCVV
jgi:hypothetical protein